MSKPFTMARFREIKEQHYQSLNKNKELIMVILPSHLEELVHSVAIDSEEAKQIKMLARGEQQQLEGVRIEIVKFVGEYKYNVLEEEAKQP